MITEIKIIYKVINGFYKNKNQELARLNIVGIDAGRLLKSYEAF